MNKSPRYYCTDQLTRDDEMFEYLPNIHEYETGGTTKYAVCVWNEAAGRYMRPLDSLERKRSGCSGESARTVEYFGNFTKQQAYSRATTLYGYARIQKRF